MMKEKQGNCGICETPNFERNNYFYGKLMTVRDFFAEQRYFNEKRWLINRMVNGWGVVCGLDVQPVSGSSNKVLITPGLAIDCCGHEILVCEDQEVELIPELDECEQKLQPQQREEIENYLICIEYLECKTESVHLPPIACDQQEVGEFNRIRDSYTLRVIPYEEPPLQPDPFCPNKPEDKQKTLHQYVCDKLRADCPECPESHCVILATVTIDLQGNIAIDPCSRRKLVYSNPMLYELLDCFHVNTPNVSGINWPMPDDDPISWNEFERLMKENGLQVSFNGEINGDTLNESTFVFNIKEMESGTGYLLYKNVPGTVEYDATTNTSVFRPTEDWIIEVLEGRSAIKEHGGECTVVLHGDFIMGADNTNALDGNFINGKLPSGNGIQGGDFVSMFTVEAQEPSRSKLKSKSRSRTKSKEAK
jgi:hypothetical protein